MPVIPSVETLMGQLVSCPSVNPGSKDHSPDVVGEARMVARLSEVLQPWSDEIVIHEVASGRPNLIARFDGVDTSRSYAMEAHTDTVGIAGMTIDPFRADIRDGQLFGRGSCDTKGPMTAMLLALMEAKQAHGKLPVTWYFIATCDEEIGGLGARNIVEKGLRFDGIIVAEPTNLDPIHIHKGAHRYRITVRGKAVHSAYPELGANAIHGAAALIRLLEDGVEEINRTLPESPSGPMTLSVGVIQGGDQVNRVPDQVVMEVDTRFSFGLTSDVIDAMLTKAKSEVESARAGIRIIIEATQSYPAFALAQDSPFRKIIRPLTESQSTQDNAARYTTNAGFYANANIPCVVFGPGDIAQAHTADEWIDLKSIRKAIGTLTTVIEQSGLT